MRACFLLIAAVLASPAQAFASPATIEYERLQLNTKAEGHTHLSGRLDFIAEQPAFVQVRPAIIYKWHALELATGYAWINHYQTRQYLETRPFVLARLTQSFSYGSHYEQFAFVIRNYPDEAGVMQHVPRISLRYAQNYWSGRRPLPDRLQRFMLYEEIAIKLGNGAGTFDYERLWAMYEFPLGTSRCQVGFRLQQSQRGSGEPPDVKYGPQVTFVVGP